MAQPTSHPGRLDAPDLIADLYQLAFVQQLTDETPPSSGSTICDTSLISVLRSYAALLSGTNHPSEAAALTAYADRMVVRERHAIL